MAALLRKKNFGPNDIFRSWTYVDIERKLYKVICVGNLLGEPGAHEAPFLALLIKNIDWRWGNQRGREP